MEAASISKYIIENNQHNAELTGNQNILHLIKSEVQKFYKTWFINNLSINYW